MHKTLGHIVGFNLPFTFAYWKPGGEKRLIRLALQLTKLYLRILSFVYSLHNSPSVPFPPTPTVPTPSVLILYTLPLWTKPKAWCDMPFSLSIYGFFSVLPPSIPSPFSSYLFLSIPPSSLTSLRVTISSLPPCPHLHPVLPLPPSQVHLSWWVWPRRLHIRGRCVWRLPSSVWTVYGTRVQQLYLLPRPKVMSCTWFIEYSVMYVNCGWKSGWVVQSTKTGCYVHYIFEWFYSTLFPGIFMIHTVSMFGFAVL